MDSEKVEVRTCQEAFDHVADQISFVQEESRDCDLQLVWTLNLFLIQVIEALNKQLGFEFDFSDVMEQVSEYVNNNFEALKVEEEKHDKFMTTIQKAYRGRSNEPKQ